MNISITMLQQKSDKQITEFIRGAYENAMNRVVKSDTVDDLKFWQGYIASLEYALYQLDKKVKIEVVIQ